MQQWFNRIQQGGGLNAARTSQDIRQLESKHIYTPKIMKCPTCSSDKVPELGVTCERNIAIDRIVSA